jgi:hypothetical protein
MGKSSSAKGFLKNMNLPFCRFYFLVVRETFRIFLSLFWIRGKADVALGTPLEGAVAATLFETVCLVTPRRRTVKRGRTAQDEGKARSVVPRRRRRHTPGSVGRCAQLGARAIPR